MYSELFEPEILLIELMTILQKTFECFRHILARAQAPISVKTMAIEAIWTLRRKLFIGYQNSLYFHQKK